MNSPSTSLWERRVEEQASSGRIFYHRPATRKGEKKNYARSDGEPLLPALSKLSVREFEWILSASADRTGRLPAIQRKADQRRAMGMVTGWFAPSAYPLLPIHFAWGHLRCILSVGQGDIGKPTAWLSRLRFRFHHRRIFQNQRVSVPIPLFCGR